MTNLHVWRQPRATGSGIVRLTALLGLPVAAMTAWLVLTDPLGGARLAAVLAVAVVVGLGAAVLLHRRPWLAPWGALFLFSTSAELRLRVDDAVGVVKDGYVLLLIAVVTVAVVRNRTPLARLRPLALPLAALGVLVLLYLLDPAGTHGSGWVFGTRLLLEVFALLALGLLSAGPERTLAHLTRAMTVLLPLEAGFAWLQQWVGADALVFGWGYEFGSQVRLTTDGGLRTSGTFEDPFQLAALAVLGLALALFVACRVEAVLLTAAAVAVLGAASVRTAVIQVGLLLLVWMVRRGWARQAVGFALIAAVGGVFVLATTTSAIRPGAPEEPLLLTLNGRSSAWAQAIPTSESLLVGNGVGARGIGSTREGSSLVTDAPAYDATAAPTASFAGDPAFLDSAYAQVQSDVGIAGSIALIAGLVGIGVVLARRTVADRGGTDHPATWAALAVLVVSALDWVGRSSLASYTTGFLTLYVLGVLLAASHPVTASRPPDRSTPSPGKALL